MLRPVCKISITQRPVSDWPNRNLSFSFTFINDTEIGTSWQNLTDTAKLIFPNKLYFKDPTGKRVTWFGKNLTGGSATAPIILRGDQITIELGYKYFQTGQTTETIETNPVFQGYISNINNRMPVELECEDNMYLLKQVSAPNKVYTASTNNLQTMLTEMLNICNSSKGTNFVAVTNDPNTTDISTNIGDFRTQNETIAQVLNRIRKDYKIESYFRGNELRCSGVVYYPQDRQQHIFGFQENIISDDLNYKRLDDFSFAIKAVSVIETQSNTLNSKGNPKTKKTRIEAFVTKDSKGNLIEIPESGFEGEKRTLNFPNIPTKTLLIQKAGENMNRLYYEGFHGKFVTFGLPFVKHGDSVVIRDNILPERNGTYMVKGVVYKFGYDTGFRQEMELDIRVDTLSSSILAQGM